MTETTCEEMFGSMDTPRTNSERAKERLTSNGANIFHMLVAATLPVDYVTTETLFDKVNKKEYENRRVNGYNYHEFIAFYSSLAAEERLVWRNHAIKNSSEVNKRAFYVEL